MTNGSDLPVELTRLVRVMEDLRTGRDVPLDGEVGRLMDEVAGAVVGAPWELAGRYVLGMLYLIRAQGVRPVGFTFPCAAGG